MKIWIIGSEVEGHESVGAEEADAVVIRQKPEGHELVTLGMSSHLPIFVHETLEDSPDLVDLQMESYGTDEELSELLDEE